MTLAGCGLAASAAEINQPPTLHALAKGEKFSYARVITFRNSGGIQHEHSTISLEVMEIGASSASVRQRISVNGAPEKTRNITASTDGKWAYSDRDSVAQDFVTWDANQFGKAPDAPQLGQTWEIDVPRSAMFAAGHAIVKVVSVHDRLLAIEATGDSGRRDDNVLDRDTHKYVPVSVRGVWKVQATYQNGIVQDFHRDDRVHYSANHNAMQTDDDIDVSIHLVSHTT